MAVFRFSALSDGQAISFTPTADVLNFDQASIAAADLRVFASGANTRIEVIAGPQIGKDVTLLNTVPFQLSVTNITFADGSRLLFGDTTSGTQNDDAANTINGTAGNDLLADFGGADTMNGGLGNDTYIVSTGDVLSDTGGIDTVESDVSWTLADAFENLTATGTQAVQLTGNNGANFLTGNSAHNFFNPRGGNDTILGGAGDDFVRLGGGGVASYGTKVIELGAGFDGLDFGGLAKSAIVVDLAAGTLTGGGEGGAGSATLLSIEQVIGDGFNDRLSGSAAAESLNGGGGNDTLDGLFGNDTLTGGLGADTFAFSTAPGNGNVRVTDFASGTDRLSFDNAAFGALGAPGSFSAGDARFAAGAGLTSGRDASDRLIYNTSTGQLFYDADGNGAGASQLVATLTGNPTLAATDIQVVGTGGGTGTQGTEGDDILTGTSGNDTIDGRGGNDQISGLAGADSLIGGTGDDTIDGGPGVDTLDGGLGNDTYVVRAGEATGFGNPGSEVFADAGGVDTVIAINMSWRLDAGIENLILRGSATETIGVGNDLNNVIRSEMPTQGEGITLDGAGGNDTLIGGSASEFFGFSGPSGNFGNDSVDGGGGRDTLVLGGTSNTVDFRAGTMTSSGGRATFTNIENVLGSASGDLLIANDSGVFFIGLDGNDTLTGGAGNDFLVGDGRSDFDLGLPSPFSGNDVINGGGGNDTLIGDGGIDRFIFDQAPGAANADVVRDFATFSDKVHLDARVMSALGVSGNFSTDDARFFAAGGATGGHDADDRVVYNISTGELFYDADGNGAGGAQLIATLQGDSAPVATDIVVDNGTGSSGQVIRGTSGNDSLIGSLGNDTLDGLAGNDTLDGGTGVDAMIGGTGNDTYIVDGFDDTVVENAGEGTDTVLSSSPILTLAANVENLTLTGTAVVGTGNALNNLIIGNSGFNDLNGGTGADTLVGGAGNDQYVVDGPGDTIIENAGEGIDEVFSSGTYTLSANVENLSLIGTGPDNGTGNALNNNLRGNGAANLLSGGDGQDDLFGGAGTGIDTLNGGLGDDFYTVIGGEVLSDAGGVDTILADLDWTLGDQFENLRLTDARSASLTGNNGANILTGNSFHNFFNPRGGNDTISGGGGDDFVRLGGGGVTTYGNKVIDLGAGFDGLDFGGLARSAIVVDLAAGTLRGGGDAGTGSATLIGIEQVIGDGFNDRLSGASGAESLNGGGGNDTLTGGGGGFDTMTGGAGADSFVFLRTLPGGGVTFISDFVSGTDKLLFDNASFTALGADGAFVAGDARFAAGAGFSSARDASDRIVYDTTTGGLWYDPDGPGGSGAQQITTLLGHPALAATDITVI